ncbi:MAG: hypothetical protein ACKPEN_17520 [Planktothrix sp.]|uniref:hypothetical protein n=1 Tax=Planktothrix sp. TaxID=3088171 RepID=UPI0038D4053F
MPPTENQVKLAISQVLSMPSAYNSPLSVLDFRINEKGIITGRFRDASRPRVFSFEIADDGITFSPFVPGRLDSLDIEEWEKFSEGYSFRLDAIRKNRTDKPKCKDGVSYPCGKSCISLKKQCKTNAKDPVSTQKKKQLKAVISEFKASDKTEKIETSKAKTSKSKIKVPDIEEPIEIGESTEPLVTPKINSPKKGFQSNEYTDEGKLMHYPLRDVAATKDLSGRDDEIAKAVDLIKQSGRNWIPVFVREVKPYEYEVVGNHLVHAAAKKAGLDRIWTINVDSDPNTLKQIELLTKGG